MTGQIVVAGTVEVTKEVDGIEMGVLTDGTAYLTGRGLARLTGAAPSTIINQKDEWSSGKRDNKLAKLLQAQGFDEPELFIPIKYQGKDANAYPEAVCMTFLEYFAFESPNPSKIAEANYRTLARAGLRIFVYRALGYAAKAPVPLEWRKFHDRLLLASSPIGYFGVFKEMADFILAAMRGGLPVDEHTVPDGSVGRLWSDHWTENDLSSKHGGRIKHEHNYPDYFPQAASNPQDIWVYPVSALGDFRIWMHREYVPKRFPKYLDGKVKKGLLTASTAEMLVELALPPEATPAPDLVDVLRDALLRVEWSGQLTDSKPSGEFIRTSWLTVGCSGCQGNHIDGHAAGCPTDAALTRAGLPDQASRDVIRAAIAGPR